MIRKRESPLQSPRGSTFSSSNDGPSLHDTLQLALELQVPDAESDEATYRLTCPKLADVIDRFLDDRVLDLSSPDIGSLPELSGEFCKCFTSALPITVILKAGMRVVKPGMMELRTIGRLVANSTLGQTGSVDLSCLDFADHAVIELGGDGEVMYFVPERLFDSTTVTGENSAAKVEDVTYGDLRFHPPARPYCPCFQLGFDLKSDLAKLSGARFQALSNVQKIWLLGSVLTDGEGDPDECVGYAPAFFDLADAGALSPFDLCLLLTRLMAGIECGLKQEPGSAPELLLLCMNDRLLRHLKDPTRQHWFTSILRRVAEVLEAGDGPDPSQLAPLVMKIETLAVGVTVATFTNALAQAKKLTH